MQNPSESQTPAVFISYRPRESSALALLLEARLRMAGFSDVFVDRNPEPDKAWRQQVKEKVEASRYFICLVGPLTLESMEVLEEIEWAEQSTDTRILSIWHSFARMDDEGTGVFRRNPAIVIYEENVAGYEGAISELLDHTK